MPLTADWVRLILQMAVFLETYYQLLYNTTKML